MKTNNNRRKKMALFIAAISLALSVAINAEEAKSGTASGSQALFTLMELPL
jgi:hypothetical protein